MNRRETFSRIQESCGRVTSSGYAIYPWGELRWEFQANGVFLSEPCVDAEGNVYFTDWNDVIYGVSREGELLFEVSGGIDPASPPTLGNDGILYVGGPDGAVYLVHD